MTPPVLGWSDAGPPTPADRKVRVERFKPGVKKVVVFLGDLLTRQMHWHPELRCSVPCLAPQACPFCHDVKFTRTNRAEGFAPTLVLNERMRQWEQAVSVFTNGGLSKLGDGPFRGRRFEVLKSQQGAATPMRVTELGELPDQFPTLPPTFSVKAVMMRVWFPQLVHAEPVELLDPIPVERRAPRVATHAAMVLDPQDAALLSAQLAARGMSNLAARVANAPPAAVVEPADGSAEETVVDHPAPRPSGKPEPVAVGDLVGRLINGVNATYGPRQRVTGPAAAVTEAEALDHTTGELVAAEVKAKAPHLNGHAGRKGGAK